MEKQKINKIISIAVLIVVFGVGWIVFSDIQEMQITEYCYHNPNETIEGDFIINCTEWLNENPDSVLKYEKSLNISNS